LVADCWAPGGGDHVAMALPLWRVSKYRRANHFGATTS